MASIKNNSQYEKALLRIEELLLVVDNNTPTENKDYVELDLLSELVAEYEEKYIVNEKPTLAEMIKLKMAEMNLTQKGLADFLEVSPSRISEYLNGKSEPTFKVARMLHKKLNIDAQIILD